MRFAQRAAVDSTGPSKEGLAAVVGHLLLILSFELLPEVYLLIASTCWTLAIVGANGLQEDNF